MNVSYCHTKFCTDTMLHEHVIKYLNTFQFVMRNSIMKYSAKDPQTCKPMKIKGKVKGVVLCLPIQNTKQY